METNTNTDTNSVQINEEDVIQMNEAYKKQRLFELKNIPNLYPHNFVLTKNLSSYRKTYDYLKNDDILFDVVECLAGRIQTIRISGSKLYFAVIESDGILLQILANAKFYNSHETFVHDKKILRRGDIVGVTGHPTRSTKGELSILPQNVTILAPCLYSVPKNTALQCLVDNGLRFNQRYLDLIVHSENREIFKTRAKVMKYIRVVNPYKSI